MLWLFGLIGVMAVGTIAYVELPPEEAGEDDQTQPASDTENDGDILSGTEGGDIIDGTFGDDQIGGYDGDDQIDSGSGDDIAAGDAGDDTLQGDTGDDTLTGGAGDDVLNGGAGHDTLFGQSDDDQLSGGEGHDALQGSAGNDTLNGGEGDDALQGGLGDDVLSGEAGGDTLFGGWGNDTIIGLEDSDPDTPSITEQPEADYLNGGGGDDVVVVGGDDIVTTGAGNDQIILGDWIANSNPAEVLDFDPSADTMMLVWDDSVDSAEAPEPSLMDHPTDADQKLVFLGDTLIASVKGDTAFDIDDLTLVPLSAAGVMGLLE